MSCPPGLLHARRLPSPAFGLLCRQVSGLVKDNLAAAGSISIKVQACPTHQ